MANPLTATTASAEAKFVESVKKIKRRCRCEGCQEEGGSDDGVLFDSEQVFSEHLGLLIEKGHTEFVGAHMDEYRALLTEEHYGEIDTLLTIADLDLVAMNPSPVKSKFSKVPGLFEMASELNSARSLRLPKAGGGKGLSTDEKEVDSLEMKAAAEGGFGNFAKFVKKGNVFGLIGSSKQKEESAKHTKSTPDTEAEAIAKVPTNVKRYLHKVHFLKAPGAEKSEDCYTEAYLDWKTPDESPSPEPPTISSGARRPLDSDRSAGHLSPKSAELDTELELEELELEELGEKMKVAPSLIRVKSDEFMCSPQRGCKGTVSNNRYMTTLKETTADGKPEYLFDGSVPCLKREGDLVDKKGKPSDVGKSRRIVFVDMKLKRLSDIDTNKLTFRCNLHFYLTWMAKYKEVRSWFEYQKKKKKGDKSTKKAWKPEWLPKVEFTNAVDEHTYTKGVIKVKPGYHPSFSALAGEMQPQEGERQHPYLGLAWDLSPQELGCDPRQAFWIRFRIDADYTFSEELELQSFPFDCQNFSIFMKLGSDKTSGADLLPFPRRGEYLLLDSQFSVLSEWRIYGVMSEWKHTDPAESKALWTYPLLAVHIKAERKWTAHLFFMIITVCMQTLGLCAFTIDTDEGIGERMSFCVTLLLADVTLLQLMFDQLPKISYVTVLDFVMWACFLFLFSITCWSAYDGKLPKIPRQGKADEAAFLWFSGLYILSVTLYVFLGCYTRWMEKQKHELAEEDLDDLMAPTCFKFLSPSEESRKAIKVTWKHEDIFEDTDKAAKNIVTKGLNMN